MKYGLGWMPDTPDKRDRYLSLALAPTALPLSVDLRADMPPVYNQGQIGSCTANAIAGAMQFIRRKQKYHDYTPSRLFIYYNERVMENTVNSDAGAMIRDGIKSVNSIGACAEEHWPYDVSQFAQKPDANAYALAPYDASLSYNRVNQDVNSMRSVLATGVPFVFGFTVYESFESDAVASTGIVPMPGKNESTLGGHAVVCCGYNHKNKLFIVRNSWGDGWGDKGYCYMPYDYLSDVDLASDMWHIDMVGKI
jgi:C1A family cysteine protease